MKKITKLILVSTTLLLTLEFADAASAWTPAAGSFEAVTTKAVHGTSAEKGIAKAEIARRAHDPEHPDFWKALLWFGGASATHEDKSYVRDQLRRIASNASDPKAAEAKAILDNGF